MQVCRDLIYSMAAGTFCTAIFLTVLYVRRRESGGTCSLSFWRYGRLAFPVALGGCLTAALSTANDTLIPITLRQSGSSASRALEQFGTFEGVVIPVLFFPSTMLCALSGILIPEIARANAAGNQRRVCQLTERVIQLTLIFAILIAAILLKFGGRVGYWMDGGTLSGKMIRILAPVVPFIYLEIVLEALLKGMGKQNFSSLNYLAEYVIRICVVLIFIPLFGFYGIVASYYTSNVFGNCNRLRMAAKTANMPFHPGKLLGEAAVCRCVFICSCRTAGTVLSCAAGACRGHGAVFWASPCRCMCWCSGCCGSGTHGSHAENGEHGVGLERFQRPAVDFTGNLSDSTALLLRCQEQVLPLNLRDIGDAEWRIIRKLCAEKRTESGGTH